MYHLSYGIRYYVLLTLSINNLLQIRRFPLICFPALICLRSVEMGTCRGWCLKEGEVYFKTRGVIHMKFKNFVIVLFQIAINN